MKLIIDISEEEYKEVLEDTYSGTPYENKIFTLIANGTPLPKGHRKLIAEPTEEEITKTIGGQNDFAECIRDSVKAVFNNAPAIIEADMESKE